MKRHVLVTCLSLFAPSLFASAPATQMQDEEQEPVAPYTTIASFDLSIPNSGAEYLLAFDEALESGHYSIWYESDFLCRGISISKVRFSSNPTDDAIWQEAVANPYQGIYHFATGSGAMAMSAELSGERLLNSQCRIHVRKANFAVPTLVTALARLGSECIPDSDLQECSFWAERLDSQIDEVLPLSAEDVARFRLQTGSIYKLRGYFLDSDEGTVFDLVSAELIM